MISQMPSRAAAIPAGSGIHPLRTQATTMITICGTTWYSETSIDATGNISRGIAFFCTSARFRTIERVPALNVSVKKCTTIRPANTWIAKFSTPLCRPMMTPITK